MDILKKVSLLIFFFSTLFVTLRVFLLGRYPDFSVYYFGSRVYLLGGNPYFPSPESFSNYVYPPFVLLLFAPFLRLTLPIASLVFTALSLAALGLGVYFCLKSLNKFTWRTYALVLSLCFLAFPTKFTLGMGQMNLIIFLLLSVVFYLQNRNRKIFAGILLGFSLAIKLFPTLLLGYFLIKKQLKLTIAALGVVCVLYGITFLIIGIPLHRIFSTSVLPGVGAAYQAEYYNQALSGFFARLPLASATGIFMKDVLSAIFVTLSFLVIYHVRRKKSSESLCFALVITLGLIINPFSWQHHFVWLILPFIITYYSIEQKKISYKLLLATAYLLVAVNVARPDHLPLLFQSHVLFGTMLLWFLQLRLLSTKK